MTVVNGWTFSVVEEPNEVLGWLKTVEIFERDPEEVGLEHPDDLNLRMRVAESRHEFEEGEDGKCGAWAQKYCYDHKRVDDCKPCGLEKYSVLHYSDRHDSECPCWECSI